MAPTKTLTRKRASGSIAEDTSSRAEHVMAELRNALLTGDLKPGQRVREVDIASWLGVSRTPVREALHRLTEAGLLAPSARGMVVVELSQKEVVGLYAMRESLEGTAARLAAQHASPFEVEQLRATVALMDKEKNDAKLKKLNRRFHDGLYAAAHNTFLLRALQGLSGAVALLPGTTFSTPGRAETAGRQHHAIVDAIAKHDADQAEKTARDHIRDALQLRLQLMFDDN